MREADAGIGILMEKNKEGGVKIVECYEGGPGEKAGLEEGDIISAIDGEDITEDEVSDVADIVRNSDKDSVVLTVHREGAEDAMEITVPVTDVELPSVFHEMLDSKIGYIRTYSLQALPANSIRKLLMTCKNREWRK